VKHRPGWRAAALVATAHLLACGGEVRDTRPNIVLIVADTVRADYLGYHGFRGPSSPALDLLASESVQFRNCFSQAPWTKPSVASLFTSLDPLRHGMTDAHDAGWTFPDGPPRLQRLSGEAVTLAEALRDAGYSTAARVSNPWLKAVTGFAQGFDDWREQRDGGTGPTTEILSAISALRKEQPFFLYLHFMGAHGPYGAAPKSTGAFEELKRSPSLGGEVLLTPDQAAGRPDYLGELLRFGSAGAERRLRNWKAGYALGVRGMDDEIGALIDGLRQSGVLEDTLLVFTSDHGEEFLEHGEWEHGRTLCNHQLHVPLLVRLPGPTRTGRVIERAVSLADLMPTLLSRAGVTLGEHEMHGLDLSPLLAADVSAAPKAAVVFASGIKGAPRSVAVQDGQYKLIVDHETGTSRYYDLAVDPEERAAKASVPSAIAKNLERAVAERTSRKTTGTLAELITSDLLQQEIDALRALGYLHGPEARSAD
jgi:arylsulfatase A-like enzyme